MPWPPETLVALEGHGVHLSGEQRDTLDRYAALILERGRALNLVSSGDYDRLHDRHLFDSLTAIPLLEGAGQTVFDLGSGAGLPGIPLAVAIPDARFVFVERARKRAAFLVYAISALGIPNAQVLWADAGDLTRQPAYARRADVLTIRALAPTETALAAARGLLKPAGVVLLWQTADQWGREPTPEGFTAQWRPTPSRDKMQRGIRVCWLGGQT